VSCAKTAEPIEMQCGMLSQVWPGNRVLHAAHICACATRRIRLNRPCAAAMRPYVKLLWRLVTLCRVWCRRAANDKDDCQHHHCCCYW